MLTDAHRRAQLIVKGRLNNTQIAQHTQCSRATVRAWRQKLADCDLNADEIAQMPETELRRLVAPGAFRRNQDFVAPDFDQLIFEVQERRVRLKTLYKEYLEGVAPPARAMSRSTFYRCYNDAADAKNVVMSFDYEPGEMIQADFVGRKKLKQPVLLADDGRERDYELFCAASAASRKTFVLAIESQARTPVLDAMARMLAFFGGVPVLVTIDNFAAAVVKARRGQDEAVISPEFLSFADHHGFSFAAARVRKPRDKAIVENAVGIVQDDVLAPLRNRRFFSLIELNAALSARVAALNARPMKSSSGDASRDELFKRIDKSGYQTLPAASYEAGRYILQIRAGCDYLVAVEGTRYSVPSRYARALLNAKLTASSIHLFHQGRIVATHPRQDNTGRIVPSPDHMPPNHQKAALTRLAGMKRYVAAIGPKAEELINLHFRTNKKASLTATAAVNLRALTGRFPTDHVEKACALAIAVGKANTRKVQAILVAGLENAEPDTADARRLKPQQNVRGADYFATLVGQGGADDA